MRDGEEGTREGISLVELTEMFPDEAAATAWFESLVWPNGRHCPHCSSTETAEAPLPKKQPYWCGACRKDFSVQIGTALERSRVPLRKWGIAIYLEMVSFKGASSMQLLRDLKVTQKTAWFMLMRIRQTWSIEAETLFSGPIEVDETYIEGWRKNMPKAKRKAMTGRGAVGKSIVAGAKDRATSRVSPTVVPGTGKPKLQGFIVAHTADGATVYTDKHKSYQGMPFDHEMVEHGVGEYVRQRAHFNGMESFWSLLKRGYAGTFHKIRAKHLDQHARKFAGPHNVREAKTVDQMAAVAAGMVGKRLMYRDLIVDNGRSSGARG